MAKANPNTRRDAAAPGTGPHRAPEPAFGPGTRSRGPVRLRGATGARGKSPRTRGAQPGNLNALKHGFYSRHMHADELAELAEATVANLNGEVALTRVAARRVLALIDEAEEPFERVALLNAITMAAMRVASLLKTKKYLSGSADDMNAALQEALKDVALEIEDPGSHGTAEG